MASENYQITSYDPDAIKSALIAFLQTKSEFADFNYEGSAINTIVDLLTRNTHYMAFLANMVANESFLSTAQNRANVVSHAQKLSYVPKSRTAATIEASVRVIPAKPSAKFSITMNKGSTFITTVDGTQYSFVTTEDAVLPKEIATGNFTTDKVTLKQGQLINQKFVYSGEPIAIQNDSIDTTTLKVYVRNGVTAEQIEFNEVDDITQTKIDDRVYFLTQNTSGFYQIEFGKDILGEEPIQGSIVNVEFVSVGKNHGNGITSLVPASTIEGFSNIVVNVTTPGYGGSEKDDIERIRFLAPRIYKAQNRAVVESDYRAIVLRDFPFIEDAIVWGGEKNDPPYYGRVFISLIPVEGYNVVDAVKRAIENDLQQYTIMATPYVVDAQYLYMDMDIEYILDNTKTANTDQTTKAAIASAVMDYNKNSLKKFDFWYNNSKLNDLITDIEGVESVQIRKKVFKAITPVKSIRTKYEFTYDNVLRPGTFKMSGYVLDISATSDIITDNGLGVLVRTKVINSITSTETVGTIDYNTGSVVFTAQFLSTTPSVLNAYVEPYEDNFYTQRNLVVSINSVNVERITNKRV